MALKRTLLSNVPRRSILIFLLGVFLLFATISLAADMSLLGREPLLRLVLSVLVTSTFAIFYATAGFVMKSQSWKVMIPIFVVHLLIMNALNVWVPTLAPFKTLDTAQLSWVQSRLDADVRAIFLSLGLGYACFVYASIVEGRRYFRVHTEIALAQEIHQVLVPAIDTKLGEFEFYGRSVPSGEVGGDLIDLAGTEEKWVAYLADVSGHGVAPGLVMGMVKSASRMLLQSGEDGEHLMPRLNEVLYPLKKPEMFATFCFVAANGNRLHVGLAGHPPILQFTPVNNEVTELVSPNMPLGILPEGEFATSEVEAESGTLFALYTDGFLEIANAKGEEFGGERLRAELQKHGREPLADIYRSLSNSIARHGAQFDDQSMLLIRKL
jgi:Stage II sporulation protein E (SpoIIE)